MGDELSFELCNLGIAHSLRVINIGSRQFAAGDDVVHFRLLFSPPIPAQDAQGMGQLIRRAAIRICRKGDPTDPQLFMWVRPTRWEMETLVMRGEESERAFWAFPTHHLEVDMATWSVTGMYLVLENNQLSYDDMAPKIQPHVDITGSFIIPRYGERYRPLEWYPLDPEDRALEGVPVAQIQQRTPVWFNLRPDKTSGSGAGKKAAAFWVERDEENKNKWKTETVEKQVKELVRKRNLMRFGRVREDDVEVVFLHNYPTAVFQEQGYVDYPWPNVPNAPGPEMEQYVKHWGASPDGVAFFPNISWTNVGVNHEGKVVGFPTQIRQTYEHCETANIDPRRAALEFKASYSSTKLPEYYMVQLYWEMMATNTCHAYLLRYRRRRGHGEDGVYKTLRWCRSYHVFRNPNVEMIFIRNVLWTIRMLEKYPDLDLATLVRTDPGQRYASCREMCKKIAESIQGRDMEIPEDELNAMDTLRWQILQEAEKGAHHLEPINSTALNRSKRRKWSAQPDAEGDPARAIALMTIEERLRSLQHLTPKVETDEDARKAFMRLCRDQQETYRLLAEEMVRLAPE